MCKRTLTLAWILGGALFVGAGFVNAKGGKAPPPPPVPVDGGVIYYGFELAVHQMDPDGSGKTEVISRPNLEAYNLVPSLMPHGGKRWFLLFEPIEGETYPKGKPRFELFAVTAEGDSVQLTNDPDLQPKFDGSFPDVPRWAVHDGIEDGKVSFLAVLWGKDGSGNDVVVKHGVYWFEVNPDSLLLHTAVAYGAGGAFLPVEFGLSTNGWAMHADYDWSPSGTAIVFVDNEVGPGLRKAEAAGGWIALQLTTDGGSGPRWSPAGDRIAFWGVQDNWKLGDESIQTIRPNGTDRRTVASRNVGPPHWSPSGTHLVYWRGTKGGNGPVYAALDIERITADGGDRTVLTRDIDGKPYPFAWRATE